ncbi:thiamine phosphate synthase superfamily [Dunaliella salina]|uniref:Thiamine phosphate synthase superfamily n=1 Tax=Dunaliella salina TaxID=3046 RepID=A0ABQ7H2S7_DUNSA|nr:thiamine phosphate synthase superfamily [Dunaliella salina]|eukprot:KAF5841152.1 thiamine phosphate synthase superfamily [Dunaliella salina]
MLPCTQARMFSGDCAPAVGSCGSTIPSAHPLASTPPAGTGLRCGGAPILANSRRKMQGIHYPTKVLPPLPLQPYVVDSHRGSQSPSMAGSEGDALDSNFGAMSSTSRRTLVQSTSLHSLEDLQGGKARYGALDYAFLSPIFDSISKKGYAAAKFDPVQLRTLLQEHGKQLPVIALGGISAENCLQALDMGFQGVAVLGSIWEAQDPVAEMERFMQQLQKHA